ncbi:hypothetical protein ACFOGJ_20395 [Marinibaculum pumilum]|uniref:Uncharacterized protein n=1 Tax=Marinibaculum pumilum TaxID=1766165 RepID=A0ABV7L5J6_9PROT
MTDKDRDTTTRAPRRNLAAEIRALIAPLGGVEVVLPPRAPMREPPRFD